MKWIETGKVDHEDGSTRTQVAQVPGGMLIRTVEQSWASRASGENRLMPHTAIVFVPCSDSQVLALIARYDPDVKPKSNWSGTAKKDPETPVTLGKIIV